jgi:hypothetical protein
MLKTRMVIHLLHGRNFVFLIRKILFFTFYCFFFSLAYVFVIGKGQKSWVSLPSGKGLRLSVAEERDRRLAGKTN